MMPDDLKPPRLTTLEIADVQEMRTFGSLVIIILVLICPMPGTVPGLEFLGPRGGGYMFAVLAAIIAVTVIQLTPHLAYKCLGMTLSPEAWRYYRAQMRRFAFALLLLVCVAVTLLPSE